MPVFERFGVLLLAAGRGSRFGGGKLAADLGGVPCLWHSATMLAECGFGAMLAVCAADTPDLGQFGFASVMLEPADAPMSRSIALGVQALAGRGCEAILLALGDMPLVPKAHILALAKGFAGDRIATRAGGVPMPPALFGAGHFAALTRLTGDRGARELIATAPAIDLAADLALDIDTVESLEQARVIFRNRNSVSR